jgi:Flp pilus assembly protein CpaB
MGRRALLVIAAMLVAAFGVGLISVYVSQADERARNNAQKVSVWVTKEDLPKGTLASKLTRSSNLVETIDVAQALAGPNSLTAADLSAFNGKVLLEPVGKGLPLQPRMFGDPAALATQTVAKDKLSIAVTLSDPARVAGSLVPGSRVTIFRTSGTGILRNTQVLLYDVKVLSANGLAEGDTGLGNRSAGAPKALVNFELSTDDAARIAFVASGSDVDLWLGLQSSERQPHTVDGPIIDSNLIPPESK